MNKKKIKDQLKALRNTIKSIEKELEDKKDFEITVVFFPSSEPGSSTGHLVVYFEDNTTMTCLPVFMMELDELSVRDIEAGVFNALRSVRTAIGMIPMSKLDWDCFVVKVLNFEIFDHPEVKNPEIKRASIKVKEMILSDYESKIMSPDNFDPEEVQEEISYYESIYNKQKF